MAGLGLASGVPPPDPRQNPGFSPVLDHNIRTLLERRREEDRRRRWPDRLADRITRFAGSMTFVALHVVLFGGWMWWNSRWSSLPKFDDSLVVLAMAASVEAIFLSTFILITQNRMAVMADRRADLDLQISLLSEHEVTRLLAVVTAMARKLGVPEADDPDLKHLQHDVRPEEVLDKLEDAPEQRGDGVERPG